MVGWLVVEKPLGTLGRMEVVFKMFALWLVSVRRTINEWEDVCLAAKGLLLCNRVFVSDVRIIGEQQMIYRDL